MALTYNDLVQQALSIPEAEKIVDETQRRLGLVKKTLLSLSSRTDLHPTTNSRLDNYYKIRVDMMKQELEIYRAYLASQLSD